MHCSSSSCSWLLITLPDFIAHPSLSLSLSLSLSFPLSLSFSLSLSPSPSLSLSSLLFLPPSLLSSPPSFPLPPSLYSSTTTRRLVGHTKDVLSVADNRQIVSVSRDHTIKLWNTLGVCRYTIQVTIMS